MIKFFTILFLFILSYTPIYSQQYWLSHPSPTPSNLRTCFFIDSLNGWIGGDSGLMIRTTNKGQSWTFQNTGATYAIISMYFLNQRLGYAISWEIDNNPPNYYGTRIFATTNGGINWSNTLLPDTNLFINSVFFLDSLNGFIGGSEGKIFYTTNSGNDWNLSVTDSGVVFGFPVREIKFYDSQNGFAAGGVFDIAGVIYKTINGGRNWSVQIVGPEPVNDLYYFDSVNVIGMGGDFEYGSSKVTTSDGGAVWDYHEFGVFGIANSIGFRTRNEGWASLGIVDSFLVSTNGGSKWKLKGTPNGAKIYKLFFIDSLNGWAVGNDGVILKYNSNLLDISENNFSIPNAITLYQNYPNPFNPFTVISYQLTVSNYVSLKVYDVTGKEIATLVNQKQIAGSFSVDFNAGNFPSGIYLYELRAVEEYTGKKYSQTKKMIILK
ncbi:MAG: T9SS type A sorting domain-containing protein [Bacteroidota bacterium]|nr:T9SS type A sorting domain-containing protein [Bacteroidota bacterium]